ncbi:MAG: hypothetical protein DRI69_02180 [Bacteroidetes bacterium]|nr:MAG: hypothetical protein DRI69_02180 [Bacteroidota bacterium]
MLKRVLLTALVFAIITGSASAQLRTGVKGGISALYVNADDVTILDTMGIPEYQLGIANTKIALHIGFFVQADLGKYFFLQPEFLFNSQTVTYLFTDIDDPDREILKDENYQTLDFPLIMGLRLGQLRIGAGPVGHLNMNLNTEIDDPVDEDEDFVNESYTTSFQTLTWGFQAGVGVDIWQLHLDARYEGNFEEFGDHMNFYGQPYSFGVRSSRLVISVGISF